MQAEDVDKMQAGREMDALIAEKVMGYRAADIVSVPEYSTHIAAAWQVVERMRKLHLSTQFARIFELETPWHWTSIRTGYFCLYVCRAALKAHLAAQEPQEELCSQCGRTNDNHTIQCPELAYS